jgi:phage baseplate assembly protein W
MPDSTGVNATTGQPLSGWQHVTQSIKTILNTAIGSRVMRRDFGSDLPRLIGRRMTPQNILLVYAAAASAIHAWEPRYRMTAGRVLNADVTGRLELEIFGTYYPRGHAGDYSVAENQTIRVVLNA